MTENEAIEVLSNELIVIADMIGYCKDFEKESDLALAYRVKRKEAHIIAISALKEIQLYKDNKLCLIPEDVYSRQCSELDAYKEIGTVEECRAAVEKQNPVKPVCKPKPYNESVGFNEEWFCPSCGAYIGYFYEGMDEPEQMEYCNECGQHIARDWSDENEDE